MADWPDLAELTQVLDLNEDPASWEDKLNRDLAAAIALVKSRVGYWDEGTDEPDEALAAAALRAAVIMQTNIPDPSAGAVFAGSRVDAGVIDSDPIFQGHMAGHRRRFSFA